MIYRQFISEEERLVIAGWVNDQYQKRCALCAVPAINELHLGLELLEEASLDRPTRAKIDCIFGANPIDNRTGGPVEGVVPPEVYRIKERIMDKFNLRHYDVQKTFMNYFLPGANLGMHRHYPPEGMADLRTNVMIQKPEGAEPIAAGRVFNVQAGDLWVFNANLNHWTNTIRGSEPRIVLGFGWTVPDFADVHWDGEPLPDPKPKWKYANIRKVWEGKHMKWVSDYYNLP